MEIQLLPILTAAPLAVTLISGTICAIASRVARNENSKVDHELSYSETTQPKGPQVRRRSTFDYTRLVSSDADISTSGRPQLENDARPRAWAIKSRLRFLLALSTVPFFIACVSVFVALNPPSNLGAAAPQLTLWEQLGVPLVTLSGWLVALTILLLIILRRIAYMDAIQPLQWFYSANFVVALFELWTGIGLVLEGLPDNPDAVILLSIVSTSMALFLIALTMPAELDMDFVHRWGYSYASAKHVISPEACASYLSWLFFSWFNSVIHIGSSKTLNSLDLPEIIPQLRARTIWSQFQIFQKYQTTATLLRKVLRFNAVSFIWQFSFVVVSTILDFSVPYFLKLFLSYIGDPEVPPKVAYLYVILIFVAQISRSLVQSQMFYMGRKINVSMMALLNAEIYAKTLTRRDMSGLVEKKKKKADNDSNPSNNEDVSSNDKDKAKGKGKKKKDEGRDNSPANAGKVVNLMSTDTTRVSGVCNFWHIGVSSPIGIALGTYLLYDLIGWSSLVGMSILIFTIPVNKLVRGRYAKAQRELSSARDDRVTLMGELIQGIRMIKFFAWEMSFSEKVLKSREIELKKLTNVYKNTIMFQLVWFSSPLLVTLSSFFCYTKVQKGEFTPAVAFTAMVLFARLKTPLNGLPAVYMALTNASVSLSRIAEYLDEPNIKDVFVNGPDRPEGSPVVGMQDVSAQWWTTESAKTPDSREAKDAPLIRTEDTDQFSLRDISVSFPVGGLSIICGPTGSGKTSLLLAMLGEMDILKGQIFLPRRLYGATDPRGINLETGLYGEGVAYVSQQAWLQNATIRDNILFGSKYEKERYDEVIEICALKRDLEIFDDGDQTEIGEKGITLSGGQKQRVSLARAIYSRAQHVLLDDCLSAVDAHTAEHIHSKCLTGPLMEDRTCVLVTHHVRLCIPTAKHVILMNHGMITLQGSVQHLREQGLLSQVLAEDEPNTDSDEDTVGDDGDVGKSSSVAGPPVLRRKSTAKDITASQGASAGSSSTAIVTATDTSTQTRDTRKLIQEETREEGRVKWSIYLVYATAAGGILFWMTLMAAFAITRMVEVSESLWIREWANAYEPESILGRFMFSNIYSAMGLSTQHLSASPVYSDSQGFTTKPLIFDTVQSSMLSNISVTSMGLVNDNAMRTIQGPTKHSTNYYLMIYALISISSSLAHVVQTIIVFYGSLRAARILYKKLLISVVRAPLRFFDTTPVGRIMNRFSKDFETVDGSIANNCAQLLSLIMSVSSIIIVLAYITPVFVFVAGLISIAYLVVGRLYISSSRELKRLHSVSRSPIYSMFGETLAGVATIRAFGEQGRFMSDLLTKIDESNRPFYFLWIANRWLSVRSDSIGAVVALSSGIFILMNPIGIDAGTAGLALTYALEFVALVNFLVREYTEIEMELNAIERITEYTTMTQEPPAVIPDRRPPAAWPTGGSIEVKDLELKYAPDLETVLKGITFSVEPRQKVGVVGRTGSGKSTLALSLFRFVEPVAGGISIDGINIGDIGLDDLRSRLTIIPQDPMLFTGTIRSNLDPFNDHVDSELWEVLRRVHLVVGSDSASVGDNEGEEGTNAGLGPNSGVGSSSSSALNSTSATQTTTPAGGKTHISFSSLDNPVSEGGSNFSQGQRQLLCMARALLRNSKIIVMDEATASVDFATDKAIQSAIQQEFENSTVICIAHRLNTIITYDKVLVLDHGRVLEYDTPFKLLDDTQGGPKSHFREMCERSGELDVLLEMVKEAESKRQLV
ncbi:hypothetical protein BGW38_001455 [Lunasporangiospora selenospora]|uniref:Uncharacterized protein n=1 Tax=Lunasporangiospora selenospora TaxID=979761 RepID=A0A9P6G216_9FUNG|nr:hypothetical protein BGW38_001455 [Lunasporangiospora selenospora]